MTTRCKAQSQSQDGHDASFISQLWWRKPFSGKREAEKSWDHPGAQPRLVQPSDCCPPGPPADVAVGLH